MFWAMRVLAFGSMGVHCGGWAFGVWTFQLEVADCEGWAQSTSARDAHLGT